jgi:hypothetical protein
MLLVRDIFYCKPGKARPMVEKFLAMQKFPKPKGMGNVRVLTDLSAEHYWTVISEMEIESFEAFMAMGKNADQMQEMGKIMEGYHDLVDHGRREIFTIER